MGFGEGLFGDWECMVHDDGIYRPSSRFWIDLRVLLTYLWHDDPMDERRAEQ